MTSCDINPHILRYMNMVESGELRACKDQIALCRLYSAEVEYSDDNMEALFDALM